jgi:hypothetical protein
MLTYFIKGLVGFEKEVFMVVFVSSVYNNKEIIKTASKNAFAKII